jgi:hypothetical protein
MKAPPAAERRSPRPEAYTTVPTRSAAATLGLARALISAVPPASQSLRLARLRDRAELLQQTWVDAGRPVETADLRKLDITLDRRWSALRGRLDACVQLGDDDHTPRAESLLGTLFPTGLDFLELPYSEEWAQSERRLVLVATDELEDELEALCGEPYLPLLQQAHAAYGQALGITKRKDSPAEAARVLEPLKQLKDAIASYARGVLGTMNEDDPESVATAEQQLDPILRARRTIASGEPTPDDPSEPVDTPLPELPTAAAATAAATTTPT